MARACFAFGDRSQVPKRQVKDQRLTMEPVLDNVGTWNVIKLGTHQHGQLCKRQLGKHKRKLLAGGTREAITIRRAPGASRVKHLPEIPVPDQTSGLLGWDRDARRKARAFSKWHPKSHPFFHSILVSIFRAFCLQNELQNGAKIHQKCLPKSIPFFKSFFYRF